MARNFAATWAQNRGGQRSDGQRRKDRSRYQHKGRGGFGDNRIAQEIQQREQSPEQFQQTWAADRGGQQRQDPAFQAQQGYLRQERSQQQQPDGATAYTQSQSGQAMKPVNQTPMGSARQTVQGYQMGGPGPTTQEMPQGYREMINRSGPTFDLPKGYHEMINRPTASQADRLRVAMTAWGQKDQGREESPASLAAREYGQERRTGKRLPQGYEDFTRRETTQELPQGYQELIDQTRQQPDESTLAERMVEGYGDQPDRPPDISNLIASGYEEGTGIVPTTGTAPTDFQAPRSVDEALQQRLLESLSTSQTAIDPKTGYRYDDPVAAAQRADYEERTRQARQQQIEELNRLGILRGGGDTAAILGQFDVGALRCQQQISADMETRQQEALNQAMQFEQQRQTGELGRGQLSQQAQQLSLDRELGRRELAAREGQMTGRFGGADTLAREEMDLRREQMEQQRAMGLAELTGQVGEGLRGYGAPVGAQTLAAQELAQRQAESEAERGLRREELTGEIAGVGGPRRSLAAQEMEQRGSQFEQELAQQEELAEAQRDLAREEMMGYTYDDRTGQLVRTVEGQRLGQEASQFEADRLLREAAITGTYGEDGAETMAAREARLQRGLQEAALTGRYGDQDTLDARQLAQREALAREGLALDRAELYGEGAEGQRTLEAEQVEREAQLDALKTELAIQQVKTGEWSNTGTTRQELIDKLSDIYNPDALTDEEYVLEQKRLAREKADREAVMDAYKTNLENKQRGEGGGEGERGGGEDVVDDGTPVTRVENSPGGVSYANYNYKPKQSVIANKYGIEPMEWQGAKNSEARNKEIDNWILASAERDGRPPGGPTIGKELFPEGMLFDDFKEFHSINFGDGEGQYTRSSQGGNTVIRTNDFYTVTNKNPEGRGGEWTFDGDGKLIRTVLKSHYTPEGIREAGDRVDLSG